MAKKKEAEQQCCEKMCAMICCPCHLDITKLIHLVRNPKPQPCMLTEAAPS